MNAETRSGREDAGAWPRMLVADLTPRWIRAATDTECGGFFDALSPGGAPLANGPKTTLAQARTLFTLSHLALQTGSTAFGDAAGTAYAFLDDHLRDGATGGYVRAVQRDGRPTGRPGDGVTRSYDMSFVILALATYARLTGRADIGAALRSAWEMIENRLTDAETGLLLEDDALADPSAPDAPPRAQNPHMHMFEATLQAFEMSGEAHWLERAARFADLGLRHFLDPVAGVIHEFRAPDLSPAPGPSGTLCEIGHQCEWAWLLHRHARLSGDGGRLPAAGRMMDFAIRRGFRREGPMRGAAFDAVDLSDGRPAASFLLWPQTEACKAFVALHEAGDPGAGARAYELISLIRRAYFSGHAFWVNQLDENGQALQPVALSRLLYHVVLSVTEGARIGLWAIAETGQAGGGGS